MSPRFVYSLIEAHRNGTANWSDQRCCCCRTKQNRW